MRSRWANVVMSSMDSRVNILASEVHVIMADFTHECLLLYTDTLNCANTAIFTRAHSFLLKYSSDDKCGYKHACSQCGQADSGKRSSKTVPPNSTPTRLRLLYRNRDTVPINFDIAMRLYMISNFTVKL
jgi:hypothetical protein